MIEENDVVMMRGTLAAVVAVAERGSVTKKEHHRTETASGRGGRTSVIIDHGVKRTSRRIAKEGLDRQRTEASAIEPDGGYVERKIIPQNSPPLLFLTLYHIQLFQHLRPAYIISLGLQHYQGAGQHGHGHGHLCGGTSTFRMEIVIYFICLVIIHRLHLPITQQEGTQIFPFTDMITSCKTKDLESFEDELLPSQHETPLSDYPDTYLPTHFLTALSGFNSCSTLFCEIPPHMHAFLCFFV
jgi:hypothetical protein